MYWYAGSRDVAGQTNPPTWSALTAARDGAKTYQKAGYRNAKLSVPQGVGHHGYDLTGLINQTTKAVPARNVYQTTRTNVQLETSRAKGARAAVTLAQAGTHVTLVQRNGSWARVTYNGRTYWVAWARLQRAQATAGPRAFAAPVQLPEPSATETPEPSAELEPRASATPEATPTQVPAPGLAQIPEPSQTPDVDATSEAIESVPAEKPTAEPIEGGEVLEAYFVTVSDEVALTSTRGKHAVPAMLLDAGEEILVLTRHEDWAFVEVEDSTYWVQWEDLEPVEESLVVLP